MVTEAAVQNKETRDEQRVSEYLQTVNTVLNQADPAGLIRAGGDENAYEFVAVDLAGRLDQLGDLAGYVRNVISLLHLTFTEYFEHRYTWVPFDWITYARQIANKACLLTVAGTVDTGRAALDEATARMSEVKEHKTEEQIGLELEFWQLVREVAAKEAAKVLASPEGRELIKAAVVSE